MSGSDLRLRQSQQVTPSLFVNGFKMALSSPPRMRHETDCNEGPGPESCSPKNPDLAAELKIGRPDQDANFDDGGLIDVNHVPAQFLTELPCIDAKLARRIVETRASISGFDSLDDMEVLLGLPPQSLDPVRDRAIFVR